MKIFGIGTSKTGTTSLAKALEILGYRAAHYPIGMLKFDSELSIQLDQINDFDALTDTPIARFYKQLDVEYPGSKFILTIREMDSWLESCKKHFWPKRAEVLASYLQESGISGIGIEGMKQLYLDMYSTTEFDTGKFTEGYHRHFNDVMSYFSNRQQDLLILDICAGEGWEQLCSFLDKPLPDQPFPKLNATLRSTQRQTIAITATFTAEPVEDSLAFWMDELDIPSKIVFAPYNQPFQQLLDPSSLLSKNQSGINVILVRLEDWGRAGDGAEGKAVADSSYSTNEKLALSSVQGIEENVQDLTPALKSATERSAVPHLVCLCPGSTAALADSNRSAFFKQTEELMASELHGVTGVHLVTTSELAAAYPVSRYYDPHGDELGHVPFTPLFFAALGTLIARKIYAIQSTPRKVIVLDCDQTLWKGVCGEDGVHGIAIDPPRKALQEFMASQHDAGMLICLCSKNNEEDIIEVFERRPEMQLKRDHIVSWRINWRPKSENIKSLADELQLGLDSFVFIDDDPVECAEVRANCPEVLTLQLPQEPERIPRFLNHLWVFDHLMITEEDKKRSALYFQNIQRERLREESMSLEGFLAGLGLDVQISEMVPRHLARVSQLTQRTNQFNFTTIRRTESDIQKLCQSGNFECLVVEVSDRFGDYGLVGRCIPSFKILRPSWRRTRSRTIHPAFLCCSRNAHRAEDLRHTEYSAQSDSAGLRSNAVEGRVWRGWGSWDCNRSASKGAARIHGLAA